MSPFVLITAIVPRSKGKEVIQAANSAGAYGGTILLGKGTASNKVLQMLGIGDSEREIAFTIVDAQKKDSVIGAIVEYASGTRSNFGILYSRPVGEKFQGGQVGKGENYMEENENFSHKLITLIINKGYAEDAMAAARAAGARGGTIIQARGTARPDDAKFFGVAIVPEKEMLLLIAEESKSQVIFDAIRNLPCLAEPGSGIMYSSPAGDVTLLGRRK